MGYANALKRWQAHPPAAIALKAIGPAQAAGCGKRASPIRWDEANIAPKMSLAEILEELPKLTPEERQQVYLRLQALEDEPEVEATPELLAAIDEAVRASEQGRVFTLEEVRAQAQAWLTR